MRVAIYARVSTSNINGQDPTIETRELHEYSERRGWTVAGEYVDVGISGTKEKRPEQDRLTLNANRCPFDCVVVWKFDRFARSVSHLLRALESFKTQGIEFVSFSEQMDTSTPASKMVFTVLGAVAELDRSLIVERVKGWATECGLSWPNIARALGVGVGTVYAAAPRRIKTVLSSNS